MAISHFVTALPTFSISADSLDNPSFRKLSTAAVSPVHRTVCLQVVEELPPKLQKIVKLFEEVRETRSKFKQVLQYGRNMKSLSKEFKSKENKVEGYVSQV